MHIAIAPNYTPPTTDLWIGRGLLQSDLILQCVQHRAVIIAAPAVATTYGAQLARQIGAELIVPERTPLKSAETKAWLEEQLLIRKYGRDTTIIAVGGGALLDLVGFVASTYLRGVSLVFIPTTLLAMVDAAIGGKTSIDTPFGKNLLGSYYPAKGIIADLETLDSLPDVEWRNGAAEILKAALIANRALWSLCDGAWRCNLPVIVEQAARVKIATIEQDPLEKGLRRILNFGHTVAHALEAVANYEIAHGEMVAIGLLAESYLSQRLGLLARQSFEEIVAKIESFGFPLSLPDAYDRAAFFHAMSYDKKAAQGRPRITLISEIGAVAPFDGAYCSEVPETLLHEMAAWMEKKCGRGSVANSL